LKLVLVLGLHAAVAGLIMHVPPISAARYIPAHLETRPMEVSFVQALPAANAPRPLQPVQRHVESIKQPKRNVQHSAPLSKPAIPRPTLTATPSTAPTSVPATTSVAPSSTSAKEDAPRIAAAPTSMPLIAARVDANYSQKSPPTYPIMSRRLHEEGKVQLLVDVSAKGDVESILVKQSSGYPRLDDVALNTVRSWHFVPARRGDVTVADSVVVPILFKLND
jgi:protein TonB